MAKVNLSHCFRSDSGDIWCLNNDTGKPCKLDLKDFEISNLPLDVTESFFEFLLNAGDKTENHVK